MALATKVYENAAKERQAEADESMTDEEAEEKSKKKKKKDDDVEEADIEEE